MAKLEIDTADLLGKLHLAALEQVSKNFKGFLKRLRKGNISRTANSFIQNTAFHENSSQLCAPPNGSAVILIHTTGTKPQSLARDMFATYMKWFGGMDEAKAKAKFDEYNKNAGLGTANAAKDSNKNGLTEFNIEIEYKLISTEKAAVDIEDAKDAINNGEKPSSSNSNKSNSSSSSSDIIGLNDSVIPEQTNKSKIWESHPFEIIFKEQSTKTTMIKEAKTKKFVKQVVKNDNVTAQKTLEQIIKEKIQQRVKDTLSEENS